MAYTMIIPGVLMSSNRPGYPSEDVAVAIVDAWIDQIKKDKGRTVLCLLDGKQLDFYGQLGDGGLLKRYRDAGLNVIHRPVKDYLIPAVSPEVLERISSDFLAAELPMLVHCSAGRDRTGAVIKYLTREPCLYNLRANVEEIMNAHCGRRGKQHFLHVAFLALRLYDDLEPMHKLAPRHRTILWVASMLHDIGTVSESSSGHAWKSGKLILEFEGRLQSGRNLMQVGEIATVAALHGIDGTTAEEPLGKVEPVISKLWTGSGIPRELQVLAGILRIADGLDRNLKQFVTDIAIHDVHVQVISKGNASENISRAQEKSGLLCKLLERNWTFKA